MRIHTSDFKTAISTAGRQIDNKITYYKNGVQKTVDNILSITPSTHADLLKTVMKELTFTSKEQINKNTIIKYEFGVKTRSGKNLFNKDTATYKNGYLKNDSGAEQTTQNSGYLTSYVKVKPNTKYTIQGSLKDTSQASHVYRLYFYNENKEWISRTSGISQNPPYTFTTPNNCYYIQFQYRLDSYNANTIQIEEGSTATSYEPYGMYEYLNMGEYIVKENDWDADLNAFTHQCYDTMLYTMVDYYTPINITYPTTVNNYINAIASECGLDFANYNTSFCNSNTEINEDYFSNLGYTFRDVLDYIAEIVAGWIIINSNGDLQIKYPTETNEEFNADFLNNYNITFKGKYGAVNSIVFSRGGDSDTIYRRDENDINSNGLHELKIEGNPFLEGMDREDFIDDVYNELHGLEYYVTDIVSTGICYLEIGDYFTFDLNKHNAIKSGMAKSGLYKAQSTTGGKIKCLLLNDELDLSDGISETIYTEEPMISITDYKSSSPTDKSIKNAVILTNKNAGQIVLKANSDGKIVQAELNADANNGSEFNVKADNINLEGYTTINGGFSVDEDGNATMNNATITGGSIELSGTESSPKFKIKNPTYIDRYTEYLPNTIRMWRGGKTTVQINSLMNAAGLTAWDYSDEDKQVIVNAWLISIKDDTNRTLIEPSGITTPSLTQTSQEQYKKNFEKLTNAKEILKNTDIYKYNLIDDKDADKKHIGFVIGDKYNYSKDITSKNNDGVDIYSMVSVLWQVVKEQEEEIKLLKERIDK